MSAAVAQQQQDKHFHQFTTKASSSGLPEGHILFIASKETEDRDTDIVRVAGINTKHFEANGPFLWAHDQGSLPIGKAVETKVVDDELHVLVEFDLEYDFAKLVYSQYQRGFLNAVSIGFLAYSDGVKKREKGGFEFVESELLELSAVPVPSNRDALAIARSAATYLEHPNVKAWAKGILDEEEPKRDAVTDEEIDAAFEAKREEEGLEMKAGDFSLLKSLALSQDELGIDLQVLELHVELDDDEREFVAEAIKEATGRTVHVSKAGRVLSATNFNKIEQATNTLQEVLDSARREEPVEDKAAEPVVDEPPAEEVTYLFDEEEEGAGDGAETNEVDDGETTWSFE